MFIAIANPGGIAPRIVPDQLPEGLSQIATNVRLHKKGVAPLRAPVTVATPTKSGPFKTIFRFGKNQPESQYWFAWPTVVDVARGPILADSEEKTYFTGDGVPKETKLDLAIQSGTDYPVASYNLKLPAPTLAPTLVQVSGTGPTLQEERAYVYTNVATFGSQRKESAPSPAATITATSSLVPKLSGFGSPPSGQYNVTHRYIYRSISNNSGTNYYFVGAIDISATEFTDTTADTAVGEALPSLYWDVPPDDLQGLIVLPSGALCAFSPSLKCVCFSVMGMPHAWPQKYRLASEYNVVAVRAMAQGVVVLTDGYPYFISSSDPENAVMQRLDEEQSCVSARSAVTFGGGVLYASPDGLVLITSSGTKLLTDSLFDRESWQALGPQNIFAAKHDGRYYGFLSSGGFVFDGAGNFTTHDITATACYVDPVLDQLYVAVGTSIKKWDAGAAKTHTLKSRRYILGNPTSFSFAKVRAASYASLTFRLFFTLNDATVTRAESGSNWSLAISAGAGVFTKTVTNGEPFRLPAGFLGKSYEIEISGTDHWTVVAVATSVDELKQA